ncbi:tetratricopeptide repeat protein [Herbidospora mongoliensis]|uniref:tetratricopeptide repeat protein n=1 Tax=Herbidospora mongoliensis TaxID=688067 RepID=UPI0008345BAD|nr:tetratricopeptide repeat protein [Herbidospora mongoliensis]
MRSLKRGGVALAGIIAIATAVTAAANLAPRAPAEVIAAPADDLQERLRRLPGDYVGWAALGSSYVDRARLTGDPSWYGKAERAVARSLEVSPGNPAGLTGRASLEAGRHEFTQAVATARQAITVNPYGAPAYGVLADSFHQLGRYPEATSAVEKMMSLAPGVSSFTRASYDAELRGDLAMAGDMLEYARRDAYQPADIAFCEHYLGELHLRQGRYDEARAHYSKALLADPAFDPARVGLARVTALSGDLEKAASLYAAVTARLPLTQTLVEQGEVLKALGRDPGWTTLKAQRELMRLNGVRDDITWAEFEADHGSPAEAVKFAQAEYARNPNVAAADALAWALHRAGRSTEALEHAKEATATGWRNALVMHHRAEIEKALGLRTDSARLVTEYNPRFSAALPALQRSS